MCPQMQWLFQQIGVKFVSLMASIRCVGEWAQTQKLISSCFQNNAPVELLLNIYLSIYSLWLGDIFSAVLTARRPCYLLPAETHQLLSCCVDRKSRWQCVETYFIFIEKYGCLSKRHFLVEVYKEMFSVINSWPQSSNRNKQLHKLNGRST